MTDRYTNNPLRNVGAFTTHDPTTTQGGAPPATGVKMTALRVQWVFLGAIILDNLIKKYYGA